MNIDVDDLSQIIRLVDGNHSLGAGALAEAILDHLPAPRIIRTPAELDALDPDSIVLDCTGHIMTHRDRLPAVVIATGEHVRACREALEGDAGEEDDT